MVCPTRLSALDCCIDANAYGALRAITESLVRLILGSPNAPQILFFVSMRDVAEQFTTVRGKLVPTNNGYQDFAILPNSRHYHFPVISVRDVLVAAATTGGASPTIMWGTRRHPRWIGHQLMADAFAYAWTTVERIPWPRRHTKLPPSAFGNRETAALEGCHRRGFLTDVNAFDQQAKQHPEDGLSETLVEQGKGWRFVSNKTKSGWEYDVSGDVGRAVGDMPALRFRVRLGWPPVLAISAMSSYNSFTDGVFWLDGGVGDAESNTNVTMRLLSYCDGETTAWTETCMHIKAGSGRMPNFISGRWRDSSTQPKTSVFTSKMVATTDVHEFNLRVKGPLGFRPFPVPTWVEGKSAFVQQPGSYLLTIVARPPLNASDAARGTKFRLMGVASC